MFVTTLQKRMLRWSSLAFILFGSALTANAQTPQPSGTSLSDHIARLSIKASQLLPYLQNEVLSHIQDWVYGIAVAVAVLVLLFSFLRLWRENSGGNANLIFSSSDRFSFLGWWARAFGSSDRWRRPGGRSPKAARSPAAPGADCCSSSTRRRGI